LRVQGIDAGAVFSGIGHAPPVLTTIEAEAPQPTPDASRDVPPWTLPLLRDALGDQLDPVLEGFADRAPLWLRVNLRRATREAVQATLARDGMESRPHGEVMTALEVTEGGRKLRLSAAYETGLVEPQDLSVQAAIARVDWPAKGRILDYCAGGGGKALAIADRVSARVFAHDAEPRRMVDLEARAARAGVEIAPLATEALPGAGPFDLVLTDVPCSGSGTWRRDPEAKWRLTPAALADLVAVQAEILDAAAGLVEPKGRLVYMTCSLFEAENAAQIDSFLARHSDWAEEWRHLDTPMTASDGFFSASLRRR
jgi:16S rRNA (cytosine967-C5)-methyltransferase